MNRVLFASFLIAVACATPAAMYIQPDIKDVPIDRLVQNLERQIAANPTDVAAHINLGRLHGMAFARKTDTAQVARFDEKEDVWYGFEPAHIPYEVTTPQGTPALTADAAMTHLRAATAAYQRALQLAPDNLTARLGYGWTLEQAGDRAAAIAEYRRVIAAAWKAEAKLTSGKLGGRYYTAEAAGYLIPLLDPAKDAAEIKELERRRMTLERLPRPITPLAIPLRNMGSKEMIDGRARVAFDADGSGTPRRWTWISRDAAWLVYDRRGTARITSALQMFGGVSFWLFWENGFHALAALDDNGDGVLAGPELRYLALWHDRNMSGISEPGEVLPVAAYGIVELSCRPSGDHASPLFAAVAPDGARLATGERRPIYDVILRSN